MNKKLLFKSMGTALLYLLGYGIVGAVFAMVGVIGGPWAIIGAIAVMIFVLVTVAQYQLEK